MKPSMKMLPYLSLLLFPFPSSLPANGLPDLKPVAPVIDCSALAAVDISSAVGDSTQVKDAVAVEQSYCRIRGTVSPAINFEVRLPLKNWTQRFLQTGCGGLCGNLNIRVDRPQSCAPAEHAELALASTDMGHQGGNDARWAAKNQQAKIDFAYRGVHATAMAAKALIAKFYGQPAKFAYFSGCSDGGREALIEAQRYPEDFDGISAGAPAMNFITQNTFYHGWNAFVNTGSEGHAILTADKLPLLHEAVVKACDKLDGLQDGIIGDPTACHFDPAAIICKAGEDAKTCLSAAEADTVRKIYQGAQTAQGEKLVISGPLPGSELSWRGVYVPASSGQAIFSKEIALGTIRNIAYEEALPQTFALADFHFDRANFDRIKAMHATYDATDPDLSKFAAHKGKLLLWHGWADPHISPLNTVAYYHALQKTLGNRRVSEFARLFLFPGGDHCARGEGPFDFELLQTLMAWTEGGLAPQKLVASKPGMTRPVFAYPAVAAYSGNGNVNEAGSFVAKKRPPIAGHQLQWLGSEFYEPAHKAK